MNFDVEVAFRETGHRKRDAIAVFIDALDIVGRVAAGFGFAESVDKIEHAVKAYGGAIEGGEIVAAH